MRNAIQCEKPACRCADFFARFEGHENELTVFRRVEDASKVAVRLGHIVNVLSSVAHTKLENYSIYSTMKYALHGFTGCLIKEARLVGVKVTGVYPGGVDTTFRVQARPDYMRPESAAQMIVQCVTAPDDVVVHELTFRPIVETNF